MVGIADIREMSEWTEDEEIRARKEYRVRQCMACMDVGRARCRPGLGLASEPNVALCSPLTGERIAARYRVRPI